MRFYLSWKFWVLILAVTTTAGAGRLCRPHMRPGCLPGIPSRDYQFNSRAGQTEALSRIAVLMEVPRRGPPVRQYAGETPLSSTKTIKVYQLNQESLILGHCRLSRVALQVHDDGRCVLNLRAEQNFPGAQQGSVGPETTPTASTTQTLHIKRNRFTVTVRGFGLFPVEESLDSPSTGKPVLFTMGPKNFWVQNGEPYNLVLRCMSEYARDYFELIDRVEVNFSYR